jgi:glycosyltransferase involved in cell wall biosynthesis
MKVLILNYEYPPLGGGAANATAYILNEYANYTDSEFHLITSSTNGFKTERHSKNIVIHYLNIGKSANLHYQSWGELIKYSVKAYRYAQKLKKSFDYELVHAFFGIPCGFLAMFLGKPFIVSLRGSDVPFYNKRFLWADKLVFQWLSKIIWKKAAAVVANSSGLQNLALQTSPATKISVIHNGVNTQEFYSINKPFDNRLIHLISTGRLIERKGFPFLIEALHELHGFQLTLLGDGNQRHELEQLAHFYNIEVTFAGTLSHEKIAEYLQKADIFVLPSLNEGMSNSILEAMACGLPIIATDTGGSMELLQGNGVIIEKQSSKAIKEALINYQQNPLQIKIQGQKSREIALKMDWKNIAESYYKLYINILQIPTDKCAE